MQKLEIGMQIRGFTLIEILVVLAIIGIITGVTLFSLGNFGGKNRVMATAEQFQEFIKLTQQQAILESRVFGIHVTKQGYETTYLSKAGKWKRINSQSIFHAKVFPHSIQVYVEQPKAHGPLIIITPSGELSAFKIIFGINAQKMALLQAKHSLLTLQKLP